MFVVDAIDGSILSAGTFSFGLVKGFFFC